MDCGQRFLFSLDDALDIIFNVQLATFFFRFKDGIFDMLHPVGA